MMKQLEILPCMKYPLMHIRKIYPLLFGCLISLQSISQDTLVVGVKAINNNYMGVSNEVNYFIDAFNSLSANKPVIFVPFTEESVQDMALTVYYKKELNTEPKQVSAPVLSDGFEKLPGAFSDYGQYETTWQERDAATERRSPGSAMLLPQNASESHEARMGVTNYKPMSGQQPIQTAKQSSTANFNWVYMADIKKILLRLEDNRNHSLRWTERYDARKDINPVQKAGLELIEQILREGQR